jgi:hypothetical protein
MPEEERREALAELLQSQTKILQTIDRLKIKANEENKKDKMQSELSQVRSYLRVGMPNRCNMIHVDGKCKGMDNS